MAPVIEAWDRQPGEGPKSWAAFCVYRDMDPATRSLSNVAQQLGKSKVLMARWFSSAVEGRQTSPGPVGVGTSAREVSTFLGRRIEVDSVLTEFIAGRRLAYRTTGGPFPFSGSFDVAAEGDGTRVTATFEATPAGMFAVLGPVFPRLVTRALRRDLASLKRLRGER